MRKRLIAAAVLIVAVFTLTGCPLDRFIDRIKGGSYP